MTDICQVCGLPKNLCVCAEISKESQKIKIRTMRRRFKKFITTITGFETKEQAKDMEKVFKKKLACGGTAKGTEVELQGDHQKKAKEILLENGFKKELIDG
ncbi:MAG: stress response translation initiation inhibitor YciH [archaeon]|nr:stress response translation initiation inhibitor YciH [archaeon]